MTTVADERWTAVRSDPAEGADVWWIVTKDAGNYETEIATVQGGYPHEKREARARLIAAAPELLAAAKQAISALDRLMGDSDLDSDDSPEMLACRALSSAIAAAEGGAP